MAKEFVEKKGNEQLKEIMDRVTSKNRLFIKRIPVKAKKRFQELAGSDFDGDYGFTIKYLLDFHDGLISSPNRMLMEQVQIMARELEQLKSTKVEEPKKKVIISLGGTKIAEKVIENE